MELLAITFYLYTIYWFMVLILTKLNETCKVQTHLEIRRPKALASWPSKPDLAPKPNLSSIIRLKPDVKKA